MRIIVYPVLLTLLHATLLVGARHLALRHSPKRRGILLMIGAGTGFSGIIGWEYPESVGGEFWLSLGTNFMIWGFVGMILMGVAALVAVFSESKESKQAMTMTALTKENRRRGRIISWFMVIGSPVCLLPTLYLLPFLQDIPLQIGTAIGACIGPLLVIFIASDLNGVSDVSYSSSGISVPNLPNSGSAPVDYGDDGGAFSSGASSGGSFGGFGGGDFGGGGATGDW
ncbi:MAG: hypothetical protein AAFV07_02430 [Bacteroidota bacterium]